MNVLLEVCVDDVAGLQAAVAGGAGRIELCSALSLGGLTPSVGLMQVAVPVPVFAMIRPRAGGFVWSDAEVEVMLAEIDAVRTAGLAGVVLGASRPDGRLDAEVLARLVAQAAGLGLTLHRCFDLVPDWQEALDMAINLGFHRILTSGQALTVTAGAGRLAEVMARADGRITIMPGSGVTDQTVGRLRHLPLREVHASCSEPHLQSGPEVEFGFAPATARKTSAARVQALCRALDALN